MKTKEKLITKHLEEFLNNWFEDFVENNDITRIQLYDEIIQSVKEHLDLYMQDEKINLVITDEDIREVVSYYNNFGVNLLQEERLYNDKDRKVYVINI